MHVLQPKARRRLPKEVAQQTRLKQHRRRVKALPTSGFNRQAVVQLRLEVVPGRDPAP